MKADFDINDSLLGKMVVPANGYDPSLLFRIPRHENRIQYAIHSESLPFIGFDVWHCYELSFLLKNGLPVSCIAKIAYSSSSKYLVESKSLKLYLNSFNMSAFGTDRQSALQRVKQVIRMDLEQLLGTEVYIGLLEADTPEALAFEGFTNNDLLMQMEANHLKPEKIQFQHYNESPELLKGQDTGENQNLKFTTNLLRSNCRVTSQPDWADLFVYMESAYRVDLGAMLQYIVSFRGENHFHEEVVEMIYKRLWDKFVPAKLMIGAMYTRRGGIDINPIRVSHTELIDKALLDVCRRTSKTARQ
jgi:7-cyano-7-deazaguanine reductase